MRAEKHKRSGRDPAAPHIISRPRAGPPNVKETVSPRRDSAVYWPPGACAPRPPPPPPRIPPPRIPPPRPPPPRPPPAPAPPSPPPRPPRRWTRPLLSTGPTPGMMLVCFFVLVNFMRTITATNTTTTIITTATAGLTCFRTRTHLLSHRSSHPQPIVVWRAGLLPILFAWTTTISLSYHDHDRRCHLRARNPGLLTRPQGRSRGMGAFSTPQARRNIARA